MKILDDGTTLTFRFSPAKTLTVDRERKKIMFGKNTAKFEDVKGFWKNFRFKGKKRVFYVVILTNKEMTRITPEIDEYDVDQIIVELKKILGEDKYAK
jgi:hypothetical protein